jgi:hypothetical protein
MSIYYCLRGGHYHFRVFMNGGKCGDLCCRQEELQQFKMAFSSHTNWVEEP